MSLDESLPIFLLHQCFIFFTVSQLSYWSLSSSFRISTAGSPDSLKGLSSKRIFFWNHSKTCASRSDWFGGKNHWFESYKIVIWGVKNDGILLISWGSTQCLMECLSHLCLWKSHCFMVRLCIFECVCIYIDIYLYTCISIYIQWYICIPSSVFSLVSIIHLCLAIHYRFTHTLEVCICIFAHLHISC